MHEALRHFELVSRPALRGNVALQVAGKGLEDGGVHDLTQLEVDLMPFRSRLDQGVAEDVASPLNRRQ